MTHKVIFILSVLKSSFKEQLNNKTNGKWIKIFVYLIRLSPKLIPFYIPENNAVTVFCADPAEKQLFPPLLGDTFFLVIKYRKGQLHT